jgi:hypothetical protein
MGPENYSVMLNLQALARKTSGQTKKQMTSGSRRVDGGARRDRTADLYNAIVALSQLSYGPEPSAEI